MTTFTDVITALVNEDRSRDEIIVHLHTVEGLTINKATKVYADYAREAGLTASVISKKSDALAWLSTLQYDSESWDAQAVREAVLDIQDKFGVAESTARDYCKAFSELRGYAHPTEDPRTAIFQYLIDHEADMSYEDLKAGFKEFASETLGRSASNINEYWKGYDLHLAIMASKEGRA